VGAIELGERDAMSVAQLVTVAGGLTRDADATKARVLRPVMNTSRRAEVPLNIKRILAGKDSDFPVLPNDVLYVPKASSFKRNLGRGLLIAIPIVPTILYLVLR
jgi:protein involved in polysaccharide export with SLBB domain